MDLKNISKVLKKINRLHELVNQLGEATSTEKDLLKAYVLDLYEAIMMENPDEVEDLEIAEMRKKLKKQKKLEKKLKKQRTKNKVKESSSTNETNDIPSPSTSVTAKSSKPVEAVKIKPEAKVVVNQALAELFVVNASSEVSDKLSQAPITDLTKAMSINERIFTINELFGGNQEEMDNILTALNGLKTFDEAKDILMRSVAPKYDWTANSKLKKARTFIKLVQRRYN